MPFFPAITGSGQDQVTAKLPPLLILIKTIPAISTTQA